MYRIKATAWLPGYPETKKSATLKIYEELKGYWLDEEGNLLTQAGGVNPTIYFGQKVKIKVVATTIPDDQEIDIEIKAKSGDDQIPLDDSRQSLKLTLKVKGGAAISGPVFLDPLWYNEEIEEYDYNSHKTEIDLAKALTFYFDAKPKEEEHTSKNLPKPDAHKLRPVTYRRNYEELIGLFNTDNSGEKDKKNNYENKFIDDNSEIKGIVDEFIQKVIEEDITISEIKTLVEEKAAVLWNAAVKQVQSGDLDDRLLYWARNKMQVWLKRNPLFKPQIDFKRSIVKKGTEFENIITLFEEKSRNYTGIDFSKAGNKEKVFITGFDPFQLDFNFLKYGIGPPTFNPSGISALSLHYGFEDYYVQTCVLPVRYKDFDKGVVEKIVKTNIKNVDIIHDDKPKWWRSNI